MRNYVIRRLLLAIPTLIGLTLLIFSLTQLFDPVERASLYIRDPRQARNVEGIIEKYGLNDPLYVQYARWLGALLEGNLGWSKSANMKVLDAIFTFFPATLELVMFSVPLTVIIGIYLGRLSALHKDRFLDHLTRVIAIVGWSLPSFWLGIVLMAVVYGQTGLFPPGRLSVDASNFVHSPNFIRYTGVNTIDAILNGQWWIFFDALQHIVLPTITLTTINVALIMRVMRSSMLESLSKTYVLAARAKGLDEKEVINKHATRTALIPVITLAGILFASLLSGVVITETVFNYTGLGYWAAHAATQLDFPAVLGFALFSGILFLGANLVVDILYAYIDPRIRLT
ncbi:ABC transporter permease [Candidatus Geothermarchaeota archaeon]|nr:MAG: ABC transporter permease [Candidatus Geothermarchaeota archaeon]